MSFEESKVDFILLSMKFIPSSSSTVARSHPKRHLAASSPTRSQYLVTMAGRRMMSSASMMIGGAGVSPLSHSLLYHSHKFRLHLHVISRRNMPLLFFLASS